MSGNTYEAAKGTPDESRRYKAFLEKLDSEDFNQNVAAPTAAAGVAAYAAPAGVAIGGTLAIGHRYLERKDEGKAFTSTDLSDAAYGGAMTGAAVQTAFRVLPAKAAVVLGAGLSGAQIGTGVNEVADGKWRTGLFDVATGGFGMWASASAAQNMTPVPKKATWQDFLPAANERLASAKQEYGGFGFRASGEAEPLVRIRHYTNRRGLRGIQEEGVIRAEDQNKVFAEAAGGKPLAPRDAESMYGLRPGHGRDYVEADVPASRVTRAYNPKTRAWELQIEGDVVLANPVFTKRR